MRNLPTYMTVCDLYLDDSYSMHDIVSYLEGLYPAYRILGPINIKRMKGAQIISCTLKVDDLEDFRDEYSL